MSDSRTTKNPVPPARCQTRRFAVGLARAFGGALVFSLPLLMTMEMWHIAFTTDRFRLAVLLLAIIPVLVGLSHYCGFEPTFDWRDDLVDAFVACAVGCATGFVVLSLFGELSTDMPWPEVAAKLALQTVPGSIGALLAEGQFGSPDEQAEAEMENCSHAGELFLMLAGALFLGLNVAPTEEMILIAQKISVIQALALAGFSLLVMHAFVYAMGFRGQAEVPEGTPRWSLLLRYTLPGYALALLTSLFLLWIFGRAEGTAAVQVVSATVVLGFPASLGAAAARLLI